MLKQGVHPKVVQERLGHSSIGVTLDTYSHVAPGLQEVATSRFDQMLKANLASVLPSSSPEPDHRSLQALSDCYQNDA